MIVLGEGGTEVDEGGCPSYAAFLIGDCDDGHSIRHDDVRSAIILLSQDPVKNPVCQYAG